MSSKQAVPEFASAGWLAAYLDLNPRTISALSRRGLFKTYRLGSHKTARYKVSEVLAALQPTDYGVDQ